MNTERIVWYRTGKLRQFGGGERVLLEGLRCFGHAGVDVQLVLHEPLSSETATFFAGYRAKVHVVPGFSVDDPRASIGASGGRFLKRVRQLRRTIAAIDPTFIVADSPIECRFLWLYSLCGKLPLPPIVTFVHGSPFQFADDATKYAIAFRRHFDQIREGDPVYRAMIPDRIPPMRFGERVRLEFESAALRAGVRMARCAFVLSEKNRAEVERLHGVRHAVLACPGGFDRDAVASAASGDLGGAHHVDRDLVSEASLPQSLTAVGRPMLLSLCRLIAKKRVDVLVRAFRTYIERTPASTATLVIAGEGPAREALQQLAFELGLAGRVVFAGFVPDADLLRWYAACDVFLNADNADYDLTVMNALAAGRPIVISTQYEVPRHLAVLRRFFFVADPDPMSYAGTIAAALDTEVRPLDRRDRGELESLTWESYFARVLDASRRAIAAHDRGRRPFAARARTT